MFANSSRVSSSQTRIHSGLVRQLERHGANPYQKPVADYNKLAFAALAAARQAAATAPLILDSGCGVGLSTARLAVVHPDHLVVGIDQSQDRLARGPLKTAQLPDNALLLRADVVDIWRLMLGANIRPRLHFLLYPNPWPKPAHLGRRWHGHPVFPSLLALGGRLECRSNWKVYVDELALAIHHFSEVTVMTETLDAVDLPPLTPFEAKYQASGHTLWRCVAQLPDTARNPFLPMRRE